PPAEAGRTKPSEDVDALLAQARAAVRSRDVATAQRLYHRALSQRPKDAQILAALAELHFDRGAYDKAVDFAERAVAVAPKRAALRLQLGDALFKVLRYADARAQYQAAAELGHAGAAARIAQVDAKLGH
ncbi:MAG: tetratricopeptide repeat protein, partial [Nannocystaceae bacterium]|nr:tetratricopeptide repeat protein [Nannocystaceae bacterium]